MMCVGRKKAKDDGNRRCNPSNIKRLCSYLSKSIANSDERPNYTGEPALSATEINSYKVDLCNLLHMPSLADVSTKEINTLIVEYFYEACNTEQTLLIDKLSQLDRLL